MSIGKQNLFTIFQFRGSRANLIKYYFISNSQRKSFFPVLVKIIFRPTKIKEVSFTNQFNIFGGAMHSQLTGCNPHWSLTCAWPFDWQADMSPDEICPINNSFAAPAVAWMQILRRSCVRSSIGNMRRTWKCPAMSNFVIQGRRNYASSRRWDLLRMRLLLRDPRYFHRIPPF